MTEIFKWMSAALSIVLVTGASAFAADRVAFGEKPSFQAGAQFDYGVSDDKKAITIMFSDLEVAVESGKLPEKVAKRVRSTATTAPVVTRVCAIVIPLKGSKSIKTSFYFQGYVSTSPGAQGILFIRVNGENKIVKFGPKSDRSFLEKVNFSSTSASEIRMTVFLLAEREGQHQNASAYLNVSTIDTDASVAKKRASPKSASR